MSELRNSVGVILRAPVVLILTVLWITNIWPIIVLGDVVLRNISIMLLNVLPIVCLPIAYPFVFAVTWLIYAFLGKNDKILPEYWQGYPDAYIKNLRENLSIKGLSTGFPTLKKMLLKGFD